MKRGLKIVRLYGQYLIVGLQAQASEERREVKGKGSFQDPAGVILFIF